jgi:hypothetical protein
MGSKVVKCATAIAMMSAALAMATHSGHATAEESEVVASNGVSVSVNADDFAGRHEYTAPAIEFTGEGGADVTALVALVRQDGKPLGTPYVAGFVAYSDDWRHYKRAVFRGGAEAPIVPTGNEVISCRSRPCRLLEGFSIRPTKADIEAHSVDGMLEIQVRSERSKNFIIRVPVSYFEAVTELASR